MAGIHLLPRAALRVGGSFHYSKDQDAAGAEDKGKSAPAEKEETDTALPQTQEELDAFVEAAFEAREKEKLAKRKAKPKPKREEPAEDEGEDDEEEAAELLRKAETRAATAEQERDAAQKEALMAKVENKLRDHLANTPGMREYIGNAPDIMLHIEKAMTHNAKDGEIARLIDSHAKAFADRSKAARRPANGAPIGGARRNIASLASREDDEPRRTVSSKPEALPARQPFSQIYYNG